MESKYSFSALEDIVRQTFATVVWSHKIQEKQSDIESSKYHWMEVINIGCASLTSAGVVGLFFTECIWMKIFTTAFSFVTIFCGAYFKSFKTQEAISSHRKTATQLLSIRNRLVILIGNIKMGS